MGTDRAPKTRQGKQVSAFGSHSPAAQGTRLTCTNALPRGATSLSLLLLAFLQPASPIYGQQPTAPPAQAVAPSSLLQPTLSELRSTIAGLHTAKWKAPGPVKDEAQGNIGSMNRDLESTLPGLLAQADAAPGAVPASFAVYRNLDALYEVLLRVSGTAELAASEEEAANVAHSLLTLDAARRALGDLILASSRQQQLVLEQARQPAPATTLAHPPAPTAVVNDGPDAASITPHRKAKPKAKAATPPPPAP